MVLTLFGLDRVPILAALFRMKFLVTIGKDLVFFDHVFRGLGHRARTGVLALGSLAETLLAGICHDYAPSCGTGLILWGAQPPGTRIVPERFCLLGAGKRR